MSGEDMDTRDAGHVEHPSWLGYLAQTAADGGTVGTAGRRHRLARQQGDQVAMNDDERLAEAVAIALYFNDSAGAKNTARLHIAEMRARGITLTPPPAPEPTYTRTFTEREWNHLINVLDDHSAPDGPLTPDGRLLVVHMSEQQPDPESGT